MAETPRRSFRLGDVYERARKVADSRGEELTPVVAKALEEYAAKGPKRIRTRKAKSQVEEGVPASA